MEDIAILIPTYKRAHKIKSLVENIEKTTKGNHNIYFVIEKEDRASQQVIEQLRKNIIYNEKPNTYVSAINTAFKKTKEPFVFCGADDIEFMDGWDVPIRKAFEDKKIGIAGSIDSWPINQTGFHASHFTARRSYIDEQGGAFDEKGVIYFTGYSHYECDAEAIQTAMTRGAFMQCKDSIVEHNHYHNNKASIDSTYLRAKEHGKGDSELYNQRRNHFEYLHYNWLWKGKKYRVNQGTLSLVLPSYNCLDYLKNTILSLIENTYHPFELIIIDDCSDPEVKEFLKGISKECTVVFNKTPKYVTYNWNLGISMAKGDYICVINNDIELSKHWDVPLMNELNDDVWVTSPLQKVPARGNQIMTSLQIYDTVKYFGFPHICGPCFMFKRELFDVIGYIPPQFLMWSNDTWISWVITQIYGKKLLDVQESIVTHYVSKSSAEKHKRDDKFTIMLRNDHLLLRAMIDDYKKHPEKKWKPYRKKDVL